MKREIVLKLKMISIARNLALECDYCPTDRETILEVIEDCDIDCLGFYEGSICDFLIEENYIGCSPDEIEDIAFNIIQELDTTIN